MQTLTSSSPRVPAQPRIPALVPLIGADTFVPCGDDGGRRRYVNLDYAASTPVMAAVWDAVEAFVPWYSSVHRGTGVKSQLSTAAFEDARDTVAEFVGARADDAVVFVRNTTEAVNVLSAALHPGTRVLASAVEHHSNLLPWRRHELRLLPLTGTPQELLDACERALRSARPRIHLVAVTGASNVTGDVWPVAELAALAHAHGARLFVDAAQLAPHRSIDMAGAGIDFVALSGHKLYAPFGAGALVGDRQLLREREPLLHGGGAIDLVTLDDVVWADAPQRNEAGSPNVVGAVALGAACRALLTVGMDTVAAHERALAERLWSALPAVPRLRRLSLWPDEVDRVGVATFNLDGYRHPLLAAVLSAEHAIGVRHGCFCAHPLMTRLLDVADREVDRLAAELRAGRRPALPGAVRASLGLGTTADDIDRLTDALQEIATAGPRLRYRCSPDADEYLLEPSGVTRPALAPVPPASTADAPMPPPARALRILFVTSAHNSLSQRALVALTDLGHRVAVEVVDSAAAIEEAVARHRPELVVCPMLKTIIPDAVWTRHRCLVVHPGPKGDRGPSSLDWAIELGMAEWGVTVLEASAEVDGGDVWAERTFRTRATGKSSLYRHEVRRAAIECVVEAVTAIANGRQTGDAVDGGDRRVVGRSRPLIRQPNRAIDWSADSTATVVRRIRAAEGHPGVLDTVAGTDFHLFGVHREATQRGAPGEIIAQRHGAVCRATVDGAVWITHLKRPGHFKLPAAHALALAGHRPDAPELPAAIHGAAPATRTFREIAYDEQGGVGYLHFEFYNGAMSTNQCLRLLDAYEYARGRPTRVIVLMGGADFFSNGIHLNVIEAADDPATESWRNLQAIDDVVRAILQTDSQLVISALSGDAAAGGVPLALAADHVMAREDIVLNPYYGHMGGLYGSEYWTYLLPRRVGPEAAAQLTSAPFAPVGAHRAAAIGLLDAAVGATAERFRAEVRRLAERLAGDPGISLRLAGKQRSRERDEQHKPLAAYRADELARSHESFFGADRSYHEARHRFVYKLGSPCSLKLGT